MDDDDAPDDEAALSVDDDLNDIQWSPDIAQEAFVNAEGALLHSSEWQHLKKPSMCMFGDDDATCWLKWHTQKQND